LDQFQVNNYLNQANITWINKPLLDSSNICLVQVINYLKLIQEILFYLILAKFYFQCMCHKRVSFVYLEQCVLSARKGSGLTILLFCLFCGNSHRNLLVHSRWWHLSFLFYSLKGFQSSALARLNSFIGKPKFDSDIKVLPYISDVLSS
jgi:hypothetical protein